MDITYIINNNAGNMTEKILGAYLFRDVTNNLYIFIIFLLYNLKVYKRVESQHFTGYHRNSPHHFFIF